MGFFSEFKAFAMRGNVIDLAVGIVIGAAFSGIVNSLVNDVITPLIVKRALDAAHLTNLEDLTIMGTVKVGKFLSSIISFIVVALALFVVIKAINATQKKEAPGTPEATTTEKLLTEIRDSLRK